MSVSLDLLISPLFTLAANDAFVYKHYQTSSTTGYVILCMSMCHPPWSSSDAWLLLCLGTCKSSASKHIKKWNQNNRLIRLSLLKCTLLPPPHVQHTATLVIADDVVFLLDGFSWYDQAQWWCIMRCSCCVADIKVRIAWTLINQGEFWQMACPIDILGIAAVNKTHHHHHHPPLSPFYDFMSPKLTPLLWLFLHLNGK